MIAELYPKISQSILHLTLDDIYEFFGPNITPAAIDARFEKMVQDKAEYEIAVKMPEEIFNRYFEIMFGHTFRIHLPTLTMDSLNQISVESLGSQLNQFVNAINLYLGNGSRENLFRLIMQLGDMYIWIDLCQVAAKASNIFVDFDDLNKWVITQLARVSEKVDSVFSKNIQIAAKVAAITKLKLRDAAFQKRTKLIIDAREGYELNLATSSEEDSVIYINSESERPLLIQAIKAHSVSNKEYEYPIILDVVNEYIKLCAKLESRKNPSQKIATPAEI